MRKLQSIALVTTLGLSLAIAPTSQAKAKVTKSSAPTISAISSSAVKKGKVNVTVTITLPASNGGSKITGSKVTAGGKSCTIKKTKTSCTIKSIKNGKALSVYANSKNIKGFSSASARVAYSAGASSWPTTPVATVVADAPELAAPAPVAADSVTSPGAPTNVTATNEASASVVSWTAPASTGGSAITSYNVTSSPGEFTCTIAVSPCAVTGLTNGTSYTFTVTATNAAGTGPASLASSSVTPAAVPGAPTDVLVRESPGFNTVRWSAPDNGGSAITSYTVTSSPGGFTCTTTELNCLPTGLSIGTSYTFTVTATNAAGTGPASLDSESFTPSR